MNQFINLLYRIDKYKNKLNLIKPDTQGTNNQLNNILKIPAIYVNPRTILLLNNL